MGWHRSCKAAALPAPLFPAKSCCQGAAGAIRPCPLGLSPLCPTLRGREDRGDGVGPGLVLLPPLPITEPAVEPPWHHGPGGAKPHPRPAVSQKYAGTRSLAFCQICLKSGNRFKPLSLPYASQAAFLGTAAASWPVSPRCFWGRGGKVVTPQLREGWLCHRVPNPFPYGPSVHLQRGQPGDVCPAPRALLPARLLHRLRHRHLLPLSGHLLRQRAAMPARRYAVWAAGGGGGGRVPPAWVAAARGARLPAQGPCIASTGR